MDIRIFNKGADTWRVTVNNKTELVADDWEEAKAYVDRLVMPTPEVRDMTAFELKQAMVNAENDFDLDHAPTRK